MTGWLIGLALRHRLLVLSFTILISVGGVWAFFKQPIDAYPDISSQVVQVITVFPGRATEEVERQVTVPIEIAMRSVPQLATKQVPATPPRSSPCHPYTAATPPGS